MMSTYVCLSVRDDISGTASAIFTNILCCLWPWLGHPSTGRRNQQDEAVLAVFFAIDNALYSRSFGTHTKKAEPIEITFGTMTRVGCRYHVLGGRPDPPRRMGIFFGGGGIKSKIASL